MKKRYILLFLSGLYIAFILIVRIPSVINGAVDKAVKLNKNFTKAYTACEIQFESQKYNEASSCFADLLMKYNRSDIRYSYAVSLANSGEYEHAKGELLYIVQNEKHYLEIVENSKKTIEQIDKTLDEIKAIKTKGYSKEQTARLDIGNYYMDLTDTIRWQNPKNITVFIEEDSKKELFKNGFEQWDKNLYNMINFKLTEDKANADITCYYVDKFDGSEGGYTDWKYIIKNNKKYFKKANIRVAKHSPYDGSKLSDKQIYSIILHEIGHALGIGGHSKSKGDIMYFSTEGYLNETGMISKRDVNTVKKIYGNI